MVAIRNHSWTYSGHELICLRIAASLLSLAFEELVQLSDTGPTDVHCRACAVLRLASHAAPAAANTAVISCAIYLSIPGAKPLEYAALQLVGGDCSSGYS